MECHQGRESKLSVDKQITDTFKLTPADEDTVVKPLVTKDRPGRPSPRPSASATCTTSRPRPRSTAPWSRAATSTTARPMTASSSTRAVQHLQRLPQPAHAPARPEAVRDLPCRRQDHRRSRQDPHERLADGLQRQRRCEGRHPGRDGRPAGEAAGRDQGVCQGSRQERHRLRRGTYPYWFADKNGDGKVDEKETKPTAPGPRAC